ncbi:MAG: type II 3-dehydroquinate dehydratase, partial [Gammaproteobacteria bacterium]
LSNVHARESFRHTSYLSDIARGVITGLGAKGYEYALAYALEAVADLSSSADASPSAGSGQASGTPDA